MSDGERHGFDDTAGVLATYGDLVVVGLLTLSALWLATAGPRGDVAGYLQVTLGFLFVFFLPGYALAAALFPTTMPRDDAGDGQMFGERPPGALSSLERVVVAVGSSVMVVPLSVFVWNFSPWGIALPQALGGIGALTGVALVVAAVRRRRVPSHLRFRASGRSWLTQISTWLGDGGTMNAILLALVVLSAGGLGFHLATVDNQEQYTEFYLLSESTENGTLVADDYPTEFTAGEPRTLYVGITNHEGRPITYTVVVTLQNVDGVDGRRRVTSVTQLDRFSVTLEPNETYQRPREIAPVTVGDHHRLTYLLYRGDPPTEPTVDTAYRTVYHWINVSARDTR